jgi:hypothetical protein
MRSVKTGTATAVVEPLKPAVATVKELETSGDLRKLMRNIAVGVMHGELRVDEAAICVKACEQINVSLYSEIKYAALIQQMGREAPELGHLPLFGSSNGAPRK